MSTLRHKNSWVAWVVGLVLVITGTLSPAQAFACADRPAMAQSAPAVNGSPHCAEMKQNAPCCCSPGEKRDKAHAANAVGAHLAAQCGCSVHAPDPQPVPATKGSVLVFAPEMALLAVSLPQIEAPDTALWIFAAPATGPPLSPVRSTGPSRAPPAL